MKANLVFGIHGMDCAEEVAILKREIGPLVGGEQNLSFDIVKGKMTIVPGVDGCDGETIMAAVSRTGMKAEPWRDDPSEHSEESFWSRHGRAVMTAASGGMMALGLVAHLVTAGNLGDALGGEHGAPPLSRALYAFAILAGGWYIAPKAWYAARRLRPDMNLLMTIAVSGALTIGEWFEAATVSFLFALSLLLESWSVRRARRAVEALMELAPPVAWLRTPEGEEVELPVGHVEPGSRILVKPGEKIPLDGLVVGGVSDVNQAPITGESSRVLKEPGAEVFAGTINGDGALEVETTKPAEETTLARIIRMVEEAQSRRAPSEQWVEKFARVYTPVILGLALTVFIVPPVVFEASWPEWAYRSLVLLVIGCPCALVISTPVSIVAALTAAARNGVLVKGGAYMEAPAHMSALAIDKTGTITEGKPSVVEIVPLNGHTESEVLKHASGIEALSSHPLARAIVEYAKECGVPSEPGESLQAIPGKGATARLNGKEYWVGSHRYLEERGQETAEVHDRLVALSAAGRTVVIVGNERHVCGFIALADTVRPEAFKAVSELRAAGIEHIAMLTGDNEGTASAIANEIGIDEVQSELLPEDKVAAVSELVSRFGSCGMVGDGVNDAPAMGRASIGISMGAAGSDAAIEASDIALMSDDLSRLPWLVRHARRTLNIIQQNIVLSIGIKILFVALTFTGYATLWAAIAADMGVSLLVIFNALRLLR